MKTNLTGRLPARLLTLLNLTALALTLVAPGASAAAPAGRGVHSILFTHWSDDSQRRFAAIMKTTKLNEVTVAPYFLPVTTPDQRYAAMTRLVLDVTAAKPLTVTWYGGFHGHDPNAKKTATVTQRGRELNAWIQSVLEGMRLRGIPRDRFCLKVCPMLEDTYRDEAEFRTSVQLILNQLNPAFFDRIVAIQRSGSMLKSKTFADTRTGARFNILREVHGDIGLKGGDVIAPDGVFVFNDLFKFNVVWKGKTQAVRETKDSYAFEYSANPTRGLANWFHKSAQEANRQVNLWRPAMNGRVQGVNQDTVSSVSQGVVNWKELNVEPQRKVGFNPLNDWETRILMAWASL